MVGGKLSRAEVQLSIDRIHTETHRSRSFKVDPGVEVGALMLIEKGTSRGLKVIPSEGAGLHRNHFNTCTSVLPNRFLMLTFY